LRSRSDFRLAKVRQESEQYAWLVVGKYALPQTGQVFCFREVSSPVTADSSAGSVGSTASRKYLQKEPVHHL
jgi:hypothetical protein